MITQSQLFFWLPGKRIALGNQIQPQSQIQKVNRRWRRSIIIIKRSRGERREAKARQGGGTEKRDREEGGGGSKSEEEEERPANTAEVRSELKEEGLLFKPAKPQTQLNTNHALFMCSCVHQIGHNEATLYFTAE